MKLFISFSVDATANNYAEDAVGVKRKHGAGVARDAVSITRARARARAVLAPCSRVMPTASREHGAGIARYPSTLQSTRREV